MSNDSDPEIAKTNELGIFINDSNEYRIVVPKAWASSKEMPRFPYLIVAAVLRMSEDSEAAQAFARELFVWAQEHVKEMAKNSDTSAPQVDWSTLTNLTRH